LDAAERARLLQIVGFSVPLGFVVFLVLWFLLGVTGYDEGVFYNSVLAVGLAMIVCVTIIRFILEARTEDSQ
jgi:hypothetical protein